MARRLSPGPLKNSTFLQRFIAAIELHGGSIGHAEAVEYMEGNPTDVIHQTPEEFAQGWIDSYDDGSEAHPARYGAS